MVASTKEKALSYFPTRSSNGSPLTKISILQRLLVSYPFARLALSVQLFSSDALHWWESSPSFVETNMESQSSRQTTKNRKKKKRLSLESITEGVEHMNVTAGHSAIQAPNIDNVKRLVRLQGVDGNRLSRQGKEKGDRIGSIEADDGELFFMYPSIWIKKREGLLG